MRQLSCSLAQTLGDVEHLFAAIDDQARSNVQPLPPLESAWQRLRSPLGGDASSSVSGLRGAGLTESEGATQPPSLPDDADDCSCERSAGDAPGLWASIELEVQDVPVDVPRLAGSDKGNRDCSRPRELLLPSTTNHRMGSRPSVLREPEDLLHAIRLQNPSPDPGSDRECVKVHEDDESSN